VAEALERKQPRPTDLTSTNASLLALPHRSIARATS